MEWLRSHVLALPPLVKLALGLGLIIVPRIARRLYIPAVVGLLLSVALIAPHALDGFGHARPLADVFSALGNSLLAFMARHEIDLSVFDRVQ